MKFRIAGLAVACAAVVGALLLGGCAEKKIDAETSNAVNADMQAKAAAGQTGMGQTSSVGSTGPGAKAPEGE